MGNQICNCKNKGDNNNEFPLVSYCSKIQYEDKTDKKENNNVSTVDQSFNKLTENVTLNVKARSNFNQFNDKLKFLSLIRLQRTIRKFLVFNRKNCGRGNAREQHNENNINAPKSHFFARKTTYNNNFKLIEAEVNTGNSRLILRE